MDADDRAVDERVLEIGIARESPEDVLEDARPRPTAEASKDRVPVPKHLGQIAPGGAGAHHPQHRLQEQPIV